MNDANANLLKQIFERAQFLRLLGIELVGFGDGWCETKVRVTPTLEQQHGFVHAGVLMTLADHTCGGAAATMLPEGQDVITVENKVSFLRPASGAAVFCRGQVLRAGKSLIFTEGEVMVERDNKRLIVAKASSTVAVIPLRTPAPAES
jgi:uncharacterized protein (TIGR00369 family)